MGKKKDKLLTSSKIQAGLTPDGHIVIQGKIPGTNISIAGQIPAIQIPGLPQSPSIPPLPGLPGGGSFPTTPPTFPSNEAKSSRPGKEGKEGKESKVGKEKSSSDAASEPLDGQTSTQYSTQSDTQPDLTRETTKTRENLPQAFFSQKQELISINSDLGLDMLLLDEFTGFDAISKPYCFYAHTLSPILDLDFYELVGKPVTISIKLEGKKTRYLNGIVSNMKLGHLYLAGQKGKPQHEKALAHYYLTIVPYFTLLNRSKNCQIFQDKNVLEIIQTIFEQHMLVNYVVDVIDPTVYPKREYCVQYNETAFNFVSRLLEEEGLFYWFQHDNKKEIMIISDDNSKFTPLPNQPEIELAHGYDVAGSQTTERIDKIQVFLPQQELRSDQFAFREYNHEQPATRYDRYLIPPDTNPNPFVPGVHRQAFSIYEHPYDYPMEHIDSELNPPVGARLAQRHMEEEKTPEITIHGHANVRDLISGHTFSLKKHSREDLNTEYLITEVRYRMRSSQSYIQSLSPSDELDQIQTWFSLIPKVVPFRPARHTPKPIIPGVQSAIVAGPEGEEIFVDKWGRVKVHFIWDRRDTEEKIMDERSSCWIRVGTEWSGERWGSIWTPRIGQEVLVAFQNGDPDHPIILRSAWHETLHMPPYPLESEEQNQFYKSVSTIKSRSTKGGDDSNFNELRFQDLKGQEQLFIQAERDRDEYVKNDARLHVHGHNNTIVCKDNKEKIKNNDSLRVGGRRDVAIATHHIEEVGGQRRIKAADTIILEAGQGIMLRVGASIITLTPSMITIDSPLVYINCGPITLQPVSFADRPPQLADDSTQFGPSSGNCNPKSGNDIDGIIPVEELARQSKTRNNQRKTKSSTGTDVTDGTDQTDGGRKNPNDSTQDTGGNTAPTDTGTKTTPNDSPNDSPNDQLNSETGGGGASKPNLLKRISDLSSALGMPPALLDQFKSAPDSLRKQVEQYAQTPYHQLPPKLQQEMSAYLNSKKP